MTELAVRAAGEDDGTVDGWTGREAWERLAARGAIPFDWVQAPDRVFVHATNVYGDPARGGAPYNVYRVQPHPPTPAAAAALAALGAATLLAAEALARETGRRMRAAAARVQPAALEVVAWVVVPGAALAAAPVPRPLQPVVEATVGAYTGRLVYSQLPTSLGVPTGHRVAGLEDFWRGLAAAAWRKRRRAWYAARVNSFEPLLALERTTGCWLWDVTDAALVLAAPALEDEAAARSAAGVALG